MRSFRHGSPIILTTACVLAIAALTSVPLPAREGGPLASNGASVNGLPPGDPAAPEAREWFGSRPWSEWTTVTGDWNAMRSWLSGRGLAISMAETADVSNVGSSGGVRATVTRGLFDTSVAADAAVLRIPGAAALVQLQWLPGGNGSEILGDAQGFSNIDAEAMPVLGELWYEQRFGSRVRAKVGRVDANSEFAYVDAASDFLSASMGFSPTIVGMTTYPTPASSASVFLQPVSAVEVGGGVFNGAPEDGRWFGWDSVFTIAQAGAKWTLPGTRLAGGAATGAWRVRGGDRAGHTSGLYLAAEQTMWAAAERNASVFLQLGTSDASSPVQRHVGGGLAIRGATRRRPLDVTGVGATWVRLGAAEGADPSELAVEIFHRVVVTPFLSVIPDVQVVKHPSGDVSRGAAAAFTCRFRFDF
jgi:carbohydrate-selective porin OprB